MEVIDLFLEGIRGGRSSYLMSDGDFKSDYKPTDQVTTNPCCSLGRVCVASPDSHIVVEEETPGVATFCFYWDVAFCF